MDSKERMSDPLEVLRMATDDALSALWIAAPCRIESFDPATMTANVTILQQSRTTLPVPDQTGNWFSWQQPGMVQKCPVFCLQGGGFRVFAPPEPGDEALAIFAHRSIDEWWANGGSNQRSSLRRFAIEDAFILPGVFSKPNAPSGINPAALEIRSKDGSIFLRMDPTGVTIQGNLMVEGSISCTGNAQLTAGSLAVSGDVTAGHVSLQGHQHSGVQSGGSETGPPV